MNEAPGRMRVVTVDRPAPALHARWRDEARADLYAAVTWRSMAVWNYVTAIAYAAGIERAVYARAAVEAAPSSPVPSPSPPARQEADGAGGSVNGYPCGGSLPPCYVLMRESRGDPYAENPTSSASGLWQVVDGTWGGYGGYSHASHAPVSVQNDFARMLWAGGSGCGHWAACS